MGIIWLDSEVHYLFDVEYDEIIKLENEHHFVKKDGLYYYAKDYYVSQTPYKSFKIPKVAGWIRVRMKHGREYGYIDGDLNFTLNSEEAHEFILSHPYWVMQREELSRSILTACELFESITSWPSPADYEKYKRWASGFSEQLSLFSIDKDGKYGVEDSLGFKVVKPEYDEIVIHEDDFRQDVFARKDGKWALIVEGWHKLENVSFVSDTLPEKTLRVEWMRVTKNGKQGLYNPFENKWIIAPEYDALYVNDHRQIIITEKGGKYGFYSDDILVPPLYEDIELGMHLSYVRVRQNDEWGFLNK